MRNSASIVRRSRSDMPTNARSGFDMARQPLKNRLPDTGIELGPGFLAARPKAAVLIAQCIATWSEVELQTGRLLATMMGVPFEPATALYLSLANQREKRRCLDPVARYVFFNEEHYKLYDIVMRVRHSAEKQRIDLAHGLFGIASGDPDGVIWIDSSDRIKNMFEVEAMLRDLHGKIFGAAISDQLLKKHTKVRDFIFHYTVGDLETVLNEIEAAHKLIIIFTGFANMVAHRHPENAIDERFLLLTNEPLVRQFQSLTQAPSES